MPVKLKSSKGPSLDALALAYQIADKAEKDAKKTKDELRPNLIALMSEAAQDERPLESFDQQVTLAELTAYDGDIRQWAAQCYPLYILTNFSTEDGEDYSVTLEENPELRKFEFEAGDFRFGRTVRMEGARFRTEDFYLWIDEALKKGEINLDTAILLDECIDIDEVVTYVFDEKVATKLMSEHPETLSHFERFSFVGSPKVALLPIAMVRPDE